MIYTYDALDRVSTFQSNDGTATYGYDSVNEVTSANYTTASGGHQPTNETYSFDGNGNRSTVDGVTTGISANNEVTADGTFTYTFDADGNRLSRERDVLSPPQHDDLVSYTWDARNRLTGVEEFSWSAASSSWVETEAITYTYDVFDHLIERVDDVIGSGTTTTQYVWDLLPPLPPGEGQGEGGVVLAFTNGTLSSRYLNGPNTSAYDQYFSTLAEENAGTGATTWDLLGPKGSVRDVIDGNGNVVDRLSYNSFGQVAYQSAPSVSHIDGFAGGLYDPSTQIVYFIHRWYDPTATVWISADPMGFAAGDDNLTRYVGNSAPNQVDRAGLYPDAAKGDDGDHGYDADDATAPLTKGDIRVTVYVREPVSGDRNAVLAGFADFGHCFVSVEGYDSKGILRRATRGFYPSAPLNSLNRKPQKGIVQSDASALKDKKYDVSYTKASNQAKDPFFPSYEKMVEYMDAYDNDETKQPYDLDDRSCAHFALDVLKEAGSKRFPDGFGKVNYQGKNILAPSALGEDLKQYGGKPKQ